MSLISTKKQKVNNITTINENSVENVIDIEYIFSIIYDHIFINSNSKYYVASFIRYIYRFKLINNFFNDNINNKYLLDKKVLYYSLNELTIYKIYVDTFTYLRCTFVNNNKIIIDLGYFDIINNNFKYNNYYFLKTISDEKNNTVYFDLIDSNKFILNKDSINQIVDNNFTF